MSHIRTYTLEYGHGDNDESGFYEIIARSDVQAEKYARQYCETHGYRYRNIEKSVNRAYRSA